MAKPMEGCFYGIRGIKFVWHGAWSDPEVVWHRHSFNYYDLEDPLWEIYKEECFDQGIEPDADLFSAWVLENADIARELLQDMLDARNAG